MVSLIQLWLPILLSAIAVFVASSVIHMVLRFWHLPDYHKFSNQDDVQAAMRKGHAGRGMYMVPFCSPEDMKNPEVAKKFDTGPIAMVFLREGGPLSMTASMLQWFALCIVISLFAGYVAATAGGTNVFRITATVTLLGFGFGPLAAATWDNLPWKVAFKRAADGLIYGVITGAVFVWLWPSA